MKEKESNIAKYYAAAEKIDGHYYIKMDAFTKQLEIYETQESVKANIYDDNVEIIEIKTSLYIDGEK